MRGFRKRLNAHTGRHYEMIGAVGAWFAANAATVGSVAGAAASAASTSYSIYSATQGPSKGPAGVSPGDVATQKAATDAAATAKRSRGYASTSLGRDFLTSGSGALKGTLGS